MMPIIILLTLTSIVVTVLFPLALKFFLKARLKRDVSYFVCFLVVLATSTVVNAIFLR